MYYIALLKKIPGRLWKTIKYMVLFFLTWLALVISSMTFGWDTLGIWLFMYPLNYTMKTYEQWEKWQLGEKEYNYRKYYAPKEFVLHGKVFDIPIGHIALGTVGWAYAMYPTGETPNSVHLVAKLPELAKDLEHTSYWSPKDRTKNVIFSIEVDEKAEAPEIKEGWRHFPGSYGLEEYIVKGRSMAAYNKDTYRAYLGYSFGHKAHRIGCEGEKETKNIIFRQCNGNFLLQKGIRVDYNFNATHLPQWQNIAEQLEALALSFYNEEKTKQLQQQPITQPIKGD